MFAFELACNRRSKQSSIFTGTSCGLDSCSRPWSRRSAGFSTPRCSAARSQRRKGTSGRAPYGKGRSPSTSPPLCRAGACQPTLSRTPSSGAASHGRCTLAWPNYNPPPRKRPAAELGPLLVALDPLHEAPPKAPASSTYLMPCRHPSFCDEILGLFPEENVGLFAVLLTCDALRTAVASCAEM